MIHITLLLPTCSHLDFTCLNVVIGHLAEVFEESTLIKTINPTLAAANSDAKLSETSATTRSSHR